MSTSSGRHTGLASLGAPGRAEDPTGRKTSSVDTEGDGRRRVDLPEVKGNDLPQTSTDLQLQEVADQAALGATSRVVQPSLLEFLR